MYKEMRSVAVMSFVASFLTAVASLVGCFNRSPALADTDPAEARRELVAQLKQKGIKSPDVLSVLEEIPRHLFVPEDVRDRAYVDRALSIGHDQTISQPYIVALMTELLDTNADQTILEVGTGSGYQAAVLSMLVKRVYTIEIVPELAQRAAGDLARLGFSGNVEVREGDGFLGWPEAAPFDGIIITCAIDRVPRPLVKQLKTGGRMVLPLGDSLSYQDLTVVTKQPDGSLEHRNVAGVVFVPMTGPHGFQRVTSLAR